jgi:hypothetical protein
MKVQYNTSMESINTFHNMKPPETEEGIPDNQVWKQHWYFEAYCWCSYPEIRELYLLSHTQMKYWYVAKDDEVRKPIILNPYRAFAVPSGRM